MRNVFRQLSVFLLLLIPIVLSSCASQDLLSEIKTSENFMQNDLVALSQLKKVVNDMRNTEQNILKGYSKRRMQSINSVQMTTSEITATSGQLVAVGQSCIKTFETMGVSKSELNDLLPIDGNEAIYGMLAVELMDAWDPNDIELVNGEYQVTVDWNKVGECILVALGGDIGREVWFECVNVYQQTGGKVSKDVLIGAVKNIIKNVSKQIGEEKLKRIAQVGSRAWNVVIVGIWVQCYFF